MKYVAYSIMKSKSGLHLSPIIHQASFVFNAIQDAQQYAIAQLEAFKKDALGTGFIIEKEELSCSNADLSLKYVISPVVDYSR